MGKEIAKASLRTDVPAPLSKLLDAANREHRKANLCAADAIDHAVRAGNALAKARDMCDAGEWSVYLAAEFQGSQRTAQKYMRLARHWKLLRDSGAAGKLASQSDAAKALTSIMRGDGQPPPQTSGTERKRRARGASSQKAMSLVEQAANLLSRIERELNGLPPSYVMRQAIKTLNDGRSEIERWLASTAAPASAEDLPPGGTIAGPEGTFPVDPPEV